jgi:hypothetical protein
MNNYRVFDGTTQYIAADHCEVLGQNIVFDVAGMIVRRYEIAEVRKVEELDDAMKVRDVVYQEEPSIVTRFEKCQ